MWIYPLRHCDDVAVGCLKTESTPVVPAHAGTHNHRYQRLREIYPTAPLEMSGTAYGSLRAQGRRGNYFKRDVSAVARRAPIHAPLSSSQKREAMPR